MRQILICSKSMNEGRKISRQFENPFDNIVIDIAYTINTQLYKLGFVTPNIITTFSLIIGIYTLYLVATYQYFLGAFTFLLAYLLDCMDGNYARRFNMVTVFGDYYDHVSDMIKIIGIMVVISLSEHVSLWQKICFIGTIIILGAFVGIHLGCQERLYSKLESPALSMFVNMCKNPVKSIKYTRWLGCGTLVLFIVGFLIYLGATKSKREK